LHVKHVLNFGREVGFGALGSGWAIWAWLDRVSPYRGEKRSKNCCAAKCAEPNRAPSHHFGEDVGVGIALGDGVGVGIGDGVGVGRGVEVEAGVGNGVGVGDGESSSSSVTVDAVTVVLCDDVVEPDDDFEAEKVELEPVVDVKELAVAVGVA
jgi:hypothetical protein